MIAIPAASARRPGAGQRESVNRIAGETDAVMHAIARLIGVTAYWIDAGLYIFELHPHAASTPISPICDFALLTLPSIWYNRPY